MIPTNQLQITFDRAAIEKKFVILEAKRDSGNYQHSLIPDLALQAAHALAVVYESGACCYILYARENLDYKNLKKVLERETDDICLREIPSTELKDHLLAQLLCNAMPALGADGRMYHNLTGKLYYQHVAWRQGRDVVPRSFWTLRIRLTWDRCVKLSVVTFCQAERKRGAPAEAQYLFDTKSGFLRRLVREDPDRNSPRFVIGSLDPAHKHTVSFLEFGSLEDFQRCRVGVLHRFLQDVKELLAPYLILHALSLPEDLRLGDKELDPRSENIKARLREVPLYLEDTVGDASSAALADLLCRELEQYSGITLRSGTPAPGEALFRIVHNNVSKWFGVRMTKQIFAGFFKKAIPVVGGVLGGGITYLSFKPCCDKLKASLQNTILSNPDYQNSEAEDAILAEFADVTTSGYEAVPGTV